MSTRVAIGRFRSRWVNEDPADPKPARRAHAEQPDRHPTPERIGFAFYADDTPREAEFQR
jgi:hypothetical protein